MRNLSHLFTRTRVIFQFDRFETFAFKSRLELNDSVYLSLGVFKVSSLDLPTTLRTT